jgi:hypothetical protein
MRRATVKKMKPKKARMSTLAAAAIDLQYMGPQPTWEGIPTSSQIGKYYNWMSFMYAPVGTKGTFTDGRAMFMTFLKAAKTSPEKMKLLQRLPDMFYVTRTSVVWNGHALASGLKLDPETLDRFKIKLKKMLEDAENFVFDPANENVESNRLSVQDHIENKAKDLTGEIDQFIDQFTEGTGEVTEGNLVEKLGTLPLSSVTAKLMVPFYEKQVAEYKIALSGKDPEVAEGYSGMTKDRLKKLTVFVSQIVTFLSRKANEERPRIVRTPKIKSAEQLVKKMKYQPTSTEPLLSSVHPVKVVGASELWVYNTKYRKLGVYRASDPSGLTVKGTTIKAYNEATSRQKKLRKPEKVLPDMLTGGIVAARKTFEEVNSVPSEMSGRISGETILLRVA